MLKALKNLSNYDIYDLITPARKKFKLPGYKLNGWYGGFIMDDHDRFVHIPNNVLALHIAELEVKKYGILFLK